MPALLNPPTAPVEVCGLQRRGKGITVIIIAQKIDLGKVGGPGHPDALPGGRQILPELLDRRMLFQGDTNRLVQGEIAALPFPGGWPRHPGQQQRRQDQGQRPGLAKTFASY